MDRGQRRIPVQYAKRVVGRKVYGGAGTYIPLKVNSAGVIPIIFASAILFFPAQLAALHRTTQTLQTIGNALSSGWLYYTLYAVFVVFFTYFYTALVFNPIDIADNLRKNGGFIPGVRPGKATVNYIETVMNRITLAGSVSSLRQSRSLRPCSSVRPTSRCWRRSVVRRSSSWWVSRWRP